MSTDLMMTENMRIFSKKYFALLTREGKSKKTDTVSLRLSGYSDVGHLMTDIIKVCILALGDDEPRSYTEIQEPNANISGVLSVLLDLIPHDEFELLDAMKEEMMVTDKQKDHEEEDWDFILECVTLRPPKDLFDVQFSEFKD